MTSKIIYHDFRSNNPICTMAKPAPTVFLTACILAKGRRLAAIDNALNVACIFLCGACSAIGLFILFLLSITG